MKIFSTHKQLVDSKTVFLRQFYIVYSQLVTIAEFCREFNNFSINAEVERFFFASRFEISNLTLFFEKSKLKPHEESKALDVRFCFYSCSDSSNYETKFTEAIADAYFEDSEHFTLRKVQKNGLSSIQ